MKKTILLFLSVLSLNVFAQQPNWYDDGERAMEYPAGKYFTGFAEGQKQSNESLEAATSRLKSSARVDALSTIRVHVQNTTINQGLSKTLRTMEGTFRQSIREFASSTTTTVDMEIPGLQTETWKNPKNGNIAAFAYVKKATLIRQLEKKITVCLTKIETALDQIEQMVAKGQKMQARDLAEKTLSNFAEVDETQKILAAVDEDADEETLQLNETRALQSRLTGMIADLKNGINIYLACDAKIFSANYPTLKGEIQGELSKLGCTFVNSADKADWIVYVTAQAREHQKANFGNMSSYFVYVEANIAVEKSATGQRIYENEISEKGGDTQSFERAARDAYKTISPEISKIIKEQIQQ